MGSVTLPSTSKSASDPNNFSDVYSNDTAITTVVNGNLDSTNLKAAANIADTQLAAPLSAVYRDVFTCPVAVPGGTTGGTYWVNTGNGALTGSGVNGAVIPASFYFDPAHYALSGRSTFVRAAVDIVCNATAPGQNITIGFAPITGLGGGSGLIAVNVGAATAAVAFTTPGASTGTRAVSADVAAPSVNSFIPFVLLGGTAAANSYIGANLRVQVRNT